MPRILREQRPERERLRARLGVEHEAQRFVRRLFQLGLVAVQTDLRLELAGQRADQRRVALAADSGVQQQGTREARQLGALLEQLGGVLDIGLPERGERVRHERSRGPVLRRAARLGEPLAKIRDAELEAACRHPSAGPFGLIEHPERIRRDPRIGLG
jgi:hypothetical protein